MDSRRPSLNRRFVTICESKLFNFPFSLIRTYIYIYIYRIIKAAQVKQEQENRRRNEYFAGRRGWIWLDIGWGTRRKNIFAGRCVVTGPTSLNISHEKERLKKRGRREGEKSPGDGLSE